MLSNQEIDLAFSIRQKVSKDDLKKITIYTLKKFSGTYENLIYDHLIDFVENRHLLRNIPILNINNLQVV